MSPLAPTAPPSVHFSSIDRLADRFPPIQQASFTAGKHPRCALLLVSPRCNNTHARFAWRDGHLFITDDDSVNGVSVNGKPIARNVPHLLASGDELGIGDIW